MTPWQLAKQFHDERMTGDFSELLGWYLTCGVVYSAPDAFMLAREVHWDSEQRKVTDDDRKNAWFIELAAGTGGADIFRRLIAVAHRPQPWVLWCRRGENRVREFDWKKLLKKVSK